MAGAGFKTFADGNVLSAAEVNTYLMQQSIMRFASSTARDTAITSPAEGYTCYLTDLGEPYLTVYDGSAWLPYDLAWQSYTPAWTATTANPTIGNGTLEGWYRRQGNFTDVRIHHKDGSTSTYGTGTYLWSLPSGVTMSGYGSMAGYGIDSLSTTNFQILFPRYGFSDRIAIVYSNSYVGQSQTTQEWKEFASTTLVPEEIVLDFRVNDV